MFSINHSKLDLVMDPNTEETEEEKGMSRLEEIKYYTSLFLGTLAICCLFAFLYACEIQLQIFPVLPRCLVVHMRLVMSYGL